MNLEDKQLVITKKAIEWLQKYGLPIIAKDFIGYTIIVNKFKKLFLAIELTGNFWLFRCNKKKNLKLTQKMIDNGLWKLYKTGFIDYKEEDAFEEFPDVNTIQLDPTKALILNGYAFAVDDFSNFDDVEDIKIV